MSMNTKFWVVTVPNSKSTLNDIIFECDIEGLTRQLECGLRAEYILGMFDKDKATRIAYNLLNHFKFVNQIN